MHFTPRRERLCGGSFPCCNENSFLDECEFLLILLLSLLAKQTLFDLVCGWCLASPNALIEILPLAVARGLLEVGAVGLWLENPRYIPERDRLIGYLRSTRYRFRRLEPVLFLCGGAESPRRDILREYLRKERPLLGVFYAERVWEHLASRLDRGALKMEADLATLADIVLIIVESPGTFTELGAFSLSAALRKKLVAIMDVQYRGQLSFICTGPIRWIDAESDFAPTVYARLDRILECVDQIDERIARIPKSKPIRLSNLADSPKHLLFFLCDLIAVIYPATVEMVEYYLREIAPSILTSDINVPTLIELAVAMNLLQAKLVRTQGKDQRFFWPALPNAVDRPFHHTRMLDLPSQRAAHVSVLLTMPDAKQILHDLRAAS